MRVLYFTIVPIAGEGNGGSMCCRNHIRRLAEDPNIDLSVIIAGQQADRDGTLSFLEQIGIAHRAFIEFRDDHSQATRGLFRSLKSRYLSEYSMPWEDLASSQTKARAEIEAAILSDQSEYIVIDYLASSLFVRLNKIKKKSVLVTLNREGDFHEELMRYSFPDKTEMSKRISTARVRSFEKRTLRSVDKVVALSAMDIPAYRLKNPGAVVTPFLEAKPNKWSYNGHKTCFFVGAVGHYPNLLALRWIVNDLAPELLKVAPDIEIRIVGAGNEHFPEATDKPNLKMLGHADAETKDRLFLEGSMLLCPVENNYGVKFKCLEALAFETPMLMSEETKIGLPYLKDAQHLSLNNPAQSAIVIAAVLSRKESLLEFQREQRLKHDRFMESQVGVWSTVIGSIPV